VYDAKTKQFFSCSLTVKGVERTIYVVPNQNSGEVDAEGNSIPVKIEEVQKEFLNVRNSHGSFEYKSRKVLKNYSFEIEDIPRKKNIEVLEVVYPYSAQELPADLKGTTFTHILGNVSALENFIIQRKLMGPGWVSLKNLKANSGAVSLSNVIFAWLYNNWSLEILVQVWVFNWQPHPLGGCIRKSSASPSHHSLLVESSNSGQSEHQNQRDSCRWFAL